ncbi:ATP-dependent acyl-CoA ligase [soil metagenome]
MPTTGPLSAPIAEPDGTLRGILERQAGRLGSCPFVHLPDGTLTYADADELANRTANALAGIGVGRGDIVAARAGNGVAMLATWFGCAKLGAVFMPVNPLLSHAPLANVLAHAGAATMICDAALAAEVVAVRHDLPLLQRLVVAGGSVSAADAGGHTWSFDDLVGSAPSSPPDALDDRPGAPTKLMYTSGTTGTPKGVVWSRHCEAVWARCYGDELIEIDEGEAVYCCLPLSHATCQGTTLSALWRGGRITIDAAFDPFGFWTRVRESEAAVFTFVGTLLAVLGRRRPRPDDLDNPVRRILGSAAPIDLWRHIEERFGLEIMEVWGQTETASCWTRPFSLPQDPGTIGRPTERFEVRLVEPGGAEVPPGVPGELWIRPTEAHVMFEGYLDHGAVSAESWTDDGWYRTGDLMSARPDGELSFVGRQREAIRRRGEMIATSDIEAAALTHPGVAEAVAVGVPDAAGVEDEIKLCVVAEDGGAIDVVVLDAHLRASLPRFMVPRYLAVLDSLPKTPTTRVRKHALSDSGAAGAWDTRRRAVVPPDPRSDETERSATCRNSP